MSRSAAHIGENGYCVPRASGDEPKAETPWLFDEMCSPRERG